jgi:hypothetical protein
LQELTYIDHACLDLLENWRKQHQSTGGDLIMDWSALQALFRKKTTGHSAITSNFKAAI